MKPVAVPLVLVLAVGASAYSKLLAPASPRTTAPASPFSALSLTTHATGVTDHQCSAPREGLPARLEVAAPPRASPKRVSPGGGDDDSNDPLGLWAPPSGPRGPKGPSVFTLNQGRAIDMLRRDYPKIFTHKPDFSIFTRDVELHDPSGRRLRGLNQYEKVFDMLRFLRRTTMQDAKMTYRLVVTDGKIRVRWTAKLWMRDPATGLTTMANGEPAVVHLDGVSNYELDDEGKVCKHVMENIILRGSEQAEPVQLALAWPSLGLATATPELALPTSPRAPIFRALGVATGWAPPHGLAALFETRADGTRTPDAPAGARSPQQTPTQQIAAQPARRRGGEPVASALSPEDETPLQRAARERAEDADKARKLAELRTPAAEQRKGGFLGVSLPTPCETSYDCERPEVCCDLLFGSVCCGGGLMIPTTDAQKALQPQAIPIPVEADNGGVPNGLRGPQPPSYPGGY